MSRVASSSSGRLARTLMRSAVATPFRLGPSLAMAIRPRLPEGSLPAVSALALPFRRAYSDKASTPDGADASRAADPSGTEDGQPASAAADSRSGTARVGGGNGATGSSTAAPSPAVSSRSLMEGLADLLPGTAKRASGNSAGASTSVPSASSASSSISSALSGLGGLDELKRMKREVDRSTEEYKFTVYSTKHNTHVTVTKPNGDVIVSMSCGNLGFRNSQARSYDAAYQVGAYVCDRLYQRGWHHQIQRLEVVLRGFGQGREAVTKVLLGNEGRLLRSKIVRVADNTRLKFGGTRSKKTRRLG